MRSVEAAELLAAREAISFAIEAGFRDFILEGDNASIIQAIREEETSLYLTSTLVMDVIAVIKKCFAITVILFAETKIWPRTYLQKMLIYFPIFEFGLRIRPFGRMM